MKNTLRITLLFILLIVFLAIVLTTQKQKSPQTLNSSANENSTNQAAPERIPITAQNDSFEPAVIDLLQHQEVLLEVNSIDKDYQFILPEFEVAALAPQGRVTEILLPAKAIGTYTFRCSSTCTGEVTVIDDDEDAVYE